MVEADPSTGVDAAQKGASRAVSGDTVEEEKAKPLEREGVKAEGQQPALTVEALEVCRDSSQTEHAAIVAENRLQRQPEVKAGRLVKVCLSPADINPRRWWQMPCFGKATLGNIAGKHNTGVPALSDQIEEHRPLFRKVLLSRPCQPDRIQEGGSCDTGG